MPYFGPYIRRPYVFKKNTNLKNFLLSKLINAEYASLRAPAFSEYSTVALTSSLDTLCQNLKDLNQKFNNCIEIDAKKNNRISVYGMRFKKLENKLNGDSELGGSSDLLHSLSNLGSTREMKDLGDDQASVLTNKINNNSLVINLAHSEESKTTSTKEQVTFFISISYLKKNYSFLFYFK